MMKDPMKEAIMRKRMAGPAIEIEIKPEGEAEELPEQGMSKDLAPVPEHMEESEDEEGKIVPGHEDEDMDLMMLSKLSDYDKQQLMEGAPKSLAGRANKMALERMKK